MGPVSALFSKSLEAGDRQRAEGRAGGCEEPVGEGKGTIPRLGAIMRDI